MGELSTAMREQLDRLPARVLVEYLAKRFGPDVGAELAERAAAGESLPADARGLVEALAERLDAIAGHWRIELSYADGRLRRVDRHHFKIGATLGLDRFDLHDLDARP